MLRLKELPAATLLHFEHVSYLVSHPGNVRHLLVGEPLGFLGRDIIVHNLLHGPFDSWSRSCGEECVGIELRLLTRRALFLLHF